MTEQHQLPSASCQGASGAPPQGEGPQVLDIEKIADKVYRMMLADLALARERGIGRMIRPRS